MNENNINLTSVSCHPRVDKLKKNVNTNKMDKKIKVVIMVLTIK